MDPEDLFLGPPEEIGPLLGIGNAIFKDADVSQNRPQGIPNLMGNTSGQEPDGSQLFRLNNLLLTVLQLMIHLLQGLYVIAQGPLLSFELLGHDIKSLGQLAHLIVSRNGHLLVQISVLTVIGLLVAYVVSFCFSANTIIYALMRKRVDNIEIAEVKSLFEEDDEEEDL